MRLKHQSLALRDGPFGQGGVAISSNRAAALDFAKLHDPVSVAGWGIAVIGGLAFWTALFLVF